MDKKTLEKNIFKYLLYSILAWDDKGKKIEDAPLSQMFFHNDAYKKDMCKDVEFTRKDNARTLYYEHKLSSTNYNVYERKDGEVIIAFRGSDSKHDWLSDFNFFKKKYDDVNTETRLSVGEETYDQMRMHEFLKSTEDFNGVLKAMKTFKDTTMCKMKNYLSAKYQVAADFSAKEFGNSILDVFNKYKDKIELHGGFAKQYLSIQKDLDRLIETYMNNRNFKKVTIVGHSLGGALAQIAYIFNAVKYNNVKKLTCYVYGAPKIGNHILSKFVREAMIVENFYSTIVDKDMIVYMPPDNLGFSGNNHACVIKSIPAPFSHISHHSFFYYLYCFINKAQINLT
ncbi:MAG: lipase family protein [Anaeroplasmataceae bacterium]